MLRMHLQALSRQLAPLWICEQEQKEPCVAGVDAKQVRRTHMLRKCRPLVPGRSNAVRLPLSVYPVNQSFHSGRLHTKMAAPLP
eukprot:2529807-Pleurochrysis_carterae.AAC.1